MADTDPLTTIFADFADEVAPRVRPAGAARVLQTVRHRRRRQGMVAIAALVVAIPAVAYAIVGNDHRKAAPASPGSSELGNAAVKLPDWARDAVVDNCPSGWIQFRNGAIVLDATKSIRLEQTIEADVDGDGTAEIVARYACVDASSTYQIVALDRDANGEMVTLGQVVAQTGPIKALCDMRAEPTGAISVEVGDQPATPRCGTGRQAPVMKTQWRTYAWTGAAFAQSAGPTEFR
ncbi:hypothetical protein ACQP2F_03395 [Actinoplanes sp. CA-030573]|uniref:hypothetical protein n=1 Tax=Actinoplanes sp. CA-030573 TaxID=3239898 RepID=UPI003D9451EF